MEKSIAKPMHVNRAEAFHIDAREWKSGFSLVEDELNFINHLLNSYVFEPNTFNLFERLQEYKDRIDSIKQREQTLLDSIVHHEHNLGGLMECLDNNFDTYYIQKHQVLKAKVLVFQADFQLLKSQIFNYAGGILKKRKP